MRGLHEPLPPPRPPGRLNVLLLLAAGLAAGFIDALFGGGGLITVPALMLRLGRTPEAIGTNKIAGAACTLAAIAVYGAAGRIPWRKAAAFSAWTGLGAAVGAFYSPRFLAPVYPVLLWAGTALCAATLLLRRRLVEASGNRPPHEALGAPACALGFLCGLYDGAWGPGGGTFMFLALLYTGGLGLVGSMAAAKIANFCSASMSLSVYALTGWVRWSVGLPLAASLALGAAAGASMGLRRAERLLAPALFTVTALLLWRLSRG